MNFRSNIHRFVAAVSRLETRSSSLPQWIAGIFFFSMKSWDFSQWSEILCVFFIRSQQRLAAILLNVRVVVSSRKSRQMSDCIGASQGRRRVESLEVGSTKGDHRRDS